MLSLFAANHGAVMPALQPALQLRGGMSIGGVEPEQVATGLNLLLGLQGVMIQNQEKIHEVYDVKATPISEFFTENGGAILAGSPSPPRWPSAAATPPSASRYGNIPTNLQNIKDFVAGTADKNGWGAPAKFLPLIVNGVLTAAMLGKIDAISSADAVKGFAIWFLANAVGLYALPNQAMEGWGIADMSPLDVSFTKLFGTMLGTMGAFAYQLADGKSAVESLGAAWAVNTAGLGASTSSPTTASATRTRPSSGWASAPSAPPRCSSREAPSSARAERRTRRTPEKRGGSGAARPTPLSSPYYTTLFLEIVQRRERRGAADRRCRRHAAGRCSRQRGCTTVFCSVDETARGNSSGSAGTRLASPKRRTSTLTMPLLDVADQESIVLRFKIGDRVRVPVRHVAARHHRQALLRAAQLPAGQVRAVPGEARRRAADLRAGRRRQRGARVRGLEFDVGDDMFDDAEIPDEEKLAVTIVTGFLGAGKTTLVNYILNEQHGKKICVIENEFGAVNIDQALVAENISSAEELISMDNGCACCTVRGDLVKALIGLKDRRKDFDAVLLETTGLADPAPILQTFESNPVLQNNYRIDCVTTLVDVKFIKQHLDEVRPEGTVNEAVQQVAFADRVLLNKVDLISPEELRAVKDTVRARPADRTTTCRSLAAAPSPRAPRLPQLLRPPSQVFAINSYAEQIVTERSRARPSTASSTRARTRSIGSTRCSASARRRWRRRARPRWRAMMRRARTTRTATATRAGDGGEPPRPRPRPGARGVGDDAHEGATPRPTSTATAGAGAATRRRRRQRRRRRRRSTTCRAWARSG